MWLAVRWSESRLHSKATTLLTEAIPGESKMLNQHRMVIGDAALKTHLHRRVFQPKVGKGENLHRESTLCIQATYVSASQTSEFVNVLKREI